VTNNANVENSEILALCGETLKTAVKNFHEGVKEGNILSIEKAISTMQSTIAYTKMWLKENTEPTVKHSPEESYEENRVL